MSRGWKAALILVALACFAVALSYPVRYRFEQKENDAGMARLAALRDAGRQRSEATSAPPSCAEAEVEPVEAPPAAAEDEAPKAEDFAAQPTEAAAIVGESAAVSDDAPKAVQGLTAQPVEAAAMAQEPADKSPVETTVVAEEPEGMSPVEATETAQEAAELPSETPVILDGPEGSPKATADRTPAAKALQPPEPPAAEATHTPEPTVAPTPNRRLRTMKAQPYPEKEKVVFDEADILPEFQELYEINRDLVGWITIPGTVIDYPIVQTDDSEFYLTHDFYGKKNINGQIILDAKCDPYTPSYNLVISGHSMKSGSMFGSLVNYMYESYWKRRKFLEVDVLTERREYVVLAAFFSADYDVDEEGFRYNVDIQYRLDMDKWLEEIKENQLYDTGIDVEFGDEFLTLTTCSGVHRKNGRFVVVCRRIREGEKIE